MIILDSKSIRATVSILALTTTLAWGASANAAAPAAIAFNIPAENTARALNEFAKAAQIHLLFPYEAAARFTAPPLQGQFGRDEALTRLIANTNLEIASESGDTITLREKAGQGQAAASDVATQVTVTGSRIRDVSPTSPVHVVTRADIDRSGYGQVSDLMRSLPENFAGGENAGVIQGSQVNPENADLGGASAVNLRGLGTGATLVLLNGHRLASNSAFQGSDISGIPMAALERVEVVPDGASALYGSDAVAGVVNFILRRDYNGSEVSARIGESADGGGEQHMVNVLSGIARPDWHVLADVQYAKQSPLGWGDRDWISTTTPADTLLDATTYRSLYLGGGVNLGEGTQLSFDLSADDRTAQRISQTTPAAAQYFSDYYTPLVSTAVTLDFDTFAGWKGHVTGSASDSLAKAVSRAPSINYYAPAKTKNDVEYVEASTDGSLLTLPSGKLKAAFGGGYRTENYRDSYGAAASREVSYVFAEAFVPLITPSETRTGLHRLELDVSARAEHYSDFGNSTNPKVGLRYVPLNDLALRATWGKSLKAPSFLQMYTSRLLELLNAADMGGTGPGTSILTYGGNANLKPERSTNWTMGADYTPRFAPGLKVTATYYDIDYTDRVVQPVANYLQALSNPIYAPFVIRNPSPAVVSQVVASTPTFYNFASSAFNPSSVVAIVEDDYENATAQIIHGLDLGVTDRFDLGTTRLDVFADASKMKLTQKTTVAAPAVELTGTIFNPPDFKARGGFTLSRGPWAATAIANFVDGEWDTAKTPNVRIGSWTTIDANLAYAFHPNGGLTDGLKVGLSASNLLDKRPPYTVTPTSGPFPHFDSANASALGRFVSLTITKDW